VTGAGNGVDWFPSPVCSNGRWRGRVVVRSWERCLFPAGKVRQRISCLKRNRLCEMKSLGVPAWKEVVAYISPIWR